MLTINFLRRRIPLTQGKVALVDAADYDSVSRFKWHAHKDNSTFYASRAGKRKEGKCGKTISMHRFLTNWAMTDHIDGNGLNNQRRNLRPCTSRQNSANYRKPAGGTSKYKGVSWSKIGKRWQVFVRKNGKPTYLGLFESEIEAAKVYNGAAIREFGEFARLNEIPSEANL